MKATIILFCAMLITFTSFAQQLSRVRQWVPASIQSKNNGTARSGQIKNIVITDYKSGSYTGTIEYGKSLGLTHSCTIIMTGKNITIQSDKRTWSGKIIQAGIDMMLVSLGSDVYYFKMAPEKQLIRSETAVIAVN
jgi:hypothetical protein